MCRRGSPPLAHFSRSRLKDIAQRMPAVTYLVALLLSSVTLLRSTQAQEGKPAQAITNAVQTPSSKEKSSPAKQAQPAAWQPKPHPFSRYQKMLNKEPFGKVPANAPAPVEAEEPPPVDEKQLAIAAVSVAEGKPVVYLIDLKTRAYQKITSEAENESKIKLVELTEASNPREVVAKVMMMAACLL